MLQEEFGAFYVAAELVPGSAPLPGKDVASAGPEAPKPTVLVVDDEKRIADSLCEILRSFGFQAIPVYDGWAALEAFERLHPDYLLSDVLMPRMNGLELAIAIRKNWPATKVLLFSGQAATADLLDRARSQGHEFAILAKPVHPQDLLARLRG